MDQSKLGLVQQLDIIAIAHQGRHCHALQKVVAVLDNRPVFLVGDPHFQRPPLRIRGSERLDGL